MRVYIIGNDGITLCREAPRAVNDGEIAVASNEELHAEFSSEASTCPVHRRSSACSSTACRVWSPESRGVMPPSPPLPATFSADPIPTTNPPPRHR